MSDPTNPAQRTVSDILAAFASCLEHGDAAGAAALFAEDARYEEPPRFAFTGREAIGAFLADFAARHHDVSYTVRRVLTSRDGDEAAAEWRFAHTRTSDGAWVAYEGMSFLTLRDGHIAAWRGYSARLPES